MTQRVETNTQTNVIPVGDQDFEATVLKASLPVVVDFTAEWCPPCRALEPVYNQLSNEFAGRLLFTRLDTDEHQVMPARLGILGVPTLIFFKDGNEIGRLVGPHPRRLGKQIEQILAQNTAV